MLIFCILNFIDRLITIIKKLTVKLNTFLTLDSWIPFLKHFLLHGIRWYAISYHFIVATLIGYFSLILRFFTVQVSANCSKFVEFYCQRLIDTLHVLSAHAIVCWADLCLTGLNTKIASLHQTN